MKRKLPHTYIARISKRLGYSRVLISRLVNGHATDPNKLLELQMAIEEEKKIDKQNAIDKVRKIYNK